jgi:hypothetical protein
MKLLLENEPTRRDFTILLSSMILVSCFSETDTADSSGSCDSGRGSCGSGSYGSGSCR